MQNSVIFLYTNKFVKKDIRKKNLDHNKIKYLGLNLTREVKDKYNEKLKVLTKLKTLKMKRPPILTE